MLSYNSDYVSLHGSRFLPEGMEGSRRHGTRRREKKMSESQKVWPCLFDIKKVKIFKADGVTCTPISPRVNRADRILKYAKFRRHSSQPIFMNKRGQICISPLKGLCRRRCDPRL